MSKVKLTKDQADAIDLLLKEHNGNKDEVIDIHCNEDYEWTEEHSPIERLKISQLARALYVGYEIEPFFKAGDYAQFLDKHGVIKIGIVDDVGIDRSHILHLNDPKSAYEIISINNSLLIKPTNIEIREEECRRFFANYCRHPWELRANDVLVNNANKKDIFSIVSVNKEKDEYYDSTHTYYDLNYLKKNYKVLCFSEQRLDVKDDA